METVKVSSDFAITIPQSIREALPWPPGEELRISLSDRYIVLRRPSSIRDLYGIAKGMPWKGDGRDRNDRY